ncbi:MAG: YHS domain protein [Kordiimonadales bacterium]|nr:MAG: YHS domain protein [Kordiimonadales bacterium]
MLQKLIIAIALIFTVAITGAAAADDSIYTGTFSSKAVSGYDTVEYFKSGVPTKGNKKFKTEYKDAEWRFSSQENLDLFLADPTKYAPQYGGYCAWAMSSGYTASGDPKQWAIVDGKLYLNYDKSIKKKWDADRPGFIVKADVEYPKKFADDE